jgi:cobalt-zinc-cadmium efflux system membrane fusion protein
MSRYRKPLIAGGALGMAALLLVAYTQLRTGEPPAESHPTADHHTAMKPADSAPSRSSAAPNAGQQTEPSAKQSAKQPVGEAEVPEQVDFPRSLWEAAGVRIAPAHREVFQEQITLTGKVSLNEDRLAHIFPLVEGRVDDVNIRFGQDVKQGEPLLVIQSKEVGTRMLQLFQDRLQLSYAQVKDNWTQEVGKNTQALITMMRGDASIDSIEARFIERPMGDYRQTLMTAYVEYLKAKTTLERLAPLSQSGAVAGRQLIEAEAARDATRAVLKSLLEQVSQDIVQNSRLSAQQVKELATSVAVSEANLKMLGYKESDLRNIDPVQQGESLAHYVISAPFDGTVIAKDVVLLERVGPERQVLTIANLSTVWITADIFETHLPLLSRLSGQTIRIQTEAWPDRDFPATVFYTGDVVQETTRTIALQAIADNPEGLLKPGMFVTVLLPNLSTEPVVQVPSLAVQEYAGQTFVFIQTGESSFEKRNIRLGRRTPEAAEILAGLQPEEPVVVTGGFALKSKMLSSLLEE